MDTTLGETCTNDALLVSGTIKGREQCVTFYRDFTAGKRFTVLLFHKVLHACGNIAFCTATVKLNCVLYVAVWTCRIL